LANPIFVKSTSDFAAGTLTLTLGSAVGSGNMLLGAGLSESGIFVKSVTDDKGNKYDLVPGGDNNGNGNGGYIVFGFRSHALITNGPTILTFHLTGTPASFFFKCVEEWVPATGATFIALDGHTNFLNYTPTVPSSMSGTTSSPFTTRHNNVFLWGLVWNSGGGGSVIAPTGAWNAQMTGGAADMFTFNMMAATANNSNAFTFSGNLGTNAIYGIFWGTAFVAQDSWCPVQTGLAYLNNTPGTTLTVTMPNPATVGNVIFGGFGAISTGTVTIQDNLGGTNYAILSNDVSTGHCIWGSTGLLTTTPTSFTVTSSISGQTAGTVAEFIPPASVNAFFIDVSGFADHLTTPSITTLSKTITTIGSGDLIYTFISSGAVFGDVPLNGFNMLSNWGQKNSDAYFIQPVAGSVTAGWNFAPSQSVMVFATALQAPTLSSTNRRIVYRRIR
jgi:hypothetical protein